MLSADNKKTPIPLRDERLVARGATRLRRLLPNKNALVKARR